MKHRNSAELLFPGSAAHVRKPQYLCDFQKATYELYKEQEERGSIPYTNPEAAYRRAFAHTLFSIFRTEAAEMNSLREEFHDIFPVMQLPFKDVDAAKVESAYLSAVAAVIDSNGPRLTKIQETRAQACKIMQEFKTEPQSNDKATYRAHLWGKLAGMLFTSENVVYQTDLKLEQLHKSYPEHKIDFAVRVRSAGANHIVCMPLLLAEVSKYPLHEQLAHEDESKLVVAMSAALLQSIGYCGHLGKSFAEKLCVYGILIGASGFEVSVMYPDFGVVEPSEKTEEPFRTLSMIYRSSRKYWRFSLFDTGLEGTPGTPDTGSRRASAFNCSWNGFEGHVIVPAKRCISYRFTRNRAIDKALDVEADREVCGYNALQPDMEGSEGLARQRVRRIFKAHAELSDIFYGESPINWTGVGVLERLGELIRAEGERIAAGLRSREFGKNHDLYFSRRLSELMLQWRTAETLKTALLNSRGKAHAPRSRLRYWKDKEGGLWVRIDKRTDGYELAVYSHPQVQSSPYFPKLRSGNLGADGRVHLTLEKITLWKEYVNKCSEQWKSEKQLRLMLAKMVLDLMSALRTLHSSGFVHADVSPNNIGFNEKAGVWQLYDFDQTLPIVESLAKQRHGGTPGYRSKHAEDTGIFRVFDDYIAMMQTCSCKFPMYLFECDDDRSDFLSLFKKFSYCSKPEGVSLEKCYLEVFEIFCKEREKAGAGSLLSDPTYLGALPIQKAIADEVQ